MKISIVTPSFNQGRFLPDCLRSVLDNARKMGPACGVEHFVIDACSTDETRRVLEEWSREHPASDPQSSPASYSFHYTSEPDKGQTDAINKGFRKTSGDWVMWLNADDYLLADALEKLVAFAALHPGTDVIYGDCRFVDEQGNSIREKREGGFDPGMLLFYGCYIPSTATFYHRRVLDRGLYLDASYKVCMDFEYYVRLLAEGCRFLHLSSTLACFRWHGTNVSSVYAQKRSEERLQVQRWYLERKGRVWMAREWLLAILFRAYQAKRLAGRLLRR